MVEIPNDLIEIIGEVPESILVQDREKLDRGE